MSLNGIDTASYQAGLKPDRVPMDFNIVKATQGTTYTNPDFTRMATATLAAGKQLGIYHYGGGGDPVKEADYFIAHLPGYLGKALLALDWEGMQNPAFDKTDVIWCKKFCDRVYEKTGVRCFIYMSKSVCRAHNWASVAKDYPLWCAQYASNERTGYQSNPWTDNGGFGAWKNATIYQYSSKGKLSCWSANLDLDIAYMTVDEWKAWAQGKPKDPVEVKYPDKSDNDLAVEVLFRAHGDGDKRKESLGNRYDGTQAEVNRLLQNTALALTATQQYLKKFGCAKLI